MSNTSKNQNTTIFNSFTTSIAKYVESLSVWKKELQMILISLYISLSCLSTIVDHTINFNTTYPLKLVDILLIIVMFILLFVNLAFIYGCYYKNRVLLFLTPAIPNFILIYIFFPKFHAFYFPLNLFLKTNGLENSALSILLNNLGSLTFVRAIYFVPLIIYCRFLFNDYTDDFIDFLDEVKEMEKKEAEEARKIAEQQEQEPEPGQIKEINNEKEESNLTDENQDMENTTIDPEAKKND